MLAVVLPQQNSDFNCTKEKPPIPVPNHLLLLLSISHLKRVAANNHRRTSTASSRKASLALGDTLNGFRDLGHLELMSRELDPVGMSQLNRSISTDSLSSISSIANNFGHDFTVGQLEVTLEFEPYQQGDQGKGLLHITLHQGKDLLEKEEGDFPGCFIRVSLGPEELSVGITKVRGLCACVPLYVSLMMSTKCPCKDREMRTVQESEDKK